LFEIESLWKKNRLQNDQGTMRFIRERSYREKTVWCSYLFRDFLFLVTLQECVIYLW